MSADAKVWQDEDGSWRAIHDGECAHEPHEAISYELVELLTDVATCMGKSYMRWTLRVYPDGKAGLSGYTW